MIIVLRKLSLCARNRQQGRDTHGSQSCPGYLTTCEGMIPALEDTVLCCSDGGIDLQVRFLRSINLVGPDEFPRLAWVGG